MRRCFVSVELSEKAFLQALHLFQHRIREREREKDVMSYFTANSETMNAERTETEPISRNMNTKWMGRVRERELAFTNFVQQKDATQSSDKDAYSLTDRVFLPNECACALLHLNFVKICDHKQDTEMASGPSTIHTQSKQSSENKKRRENT